MDDIIANIPVWNQRVLTEKTAVITGGTSGIGFCMADTFLNADCKKVLITSRDVDRLEASIGKLKSVHPEKKDSIFGVVLNLEKTDEFEIVFQQIEELFCDDKINIWVNNAGVYRGTKYGSVSDDDWDYLMDINMKANFFLTQIVSQHMIDNGVNGNILNICSSSSFRPSIDPYMISKLGMSGFTLGLAKKLVPYGIVVNGIAPGPTFTPMLKKKSGDSLFHGGVPAGRYILPQEVANLAVFLTSPMGRMIVGDVVKITGGSAVTTFDDVHY